MTNRKNSKALAKVENVALVDNEPQFNLEQHLIKKLGAFPLPSKRIGIVIPSTINHIVDGWYNTPSDVKKLAFSAPPELVEEIRQRVYDFFAQFGGFTSSEQFGGWKDSDNGRLIVERGEAVWAYGTPNRMQVEFLVTMAQSIKAVLHQDSVLIIVEDIPYLI